MESEPNYDEYVIVQPTATYQEARHDQGFIGQEEVNEGIVNGDGNGYENEEGDQDQGEAEPDGEGDPDGGDDPDGEDDPDGGNDPEGEDDPDGGDDPDDPDGEDNPDGEDDPDGQPQFQDTYSEVLNSLSRKWFSAQLSHKVSAKAANHFWDLSIQSFPNLLKLKEREGRVKKIPKFIQQRRKLNSNHSPNVKMEFAFKNKNDGSITKVTSTSTPLKALQRNPDYVKLYEIATVKVILIKLFTIMHSRRDFSQFWNS